MPAIDLGRPGYLLAGAVTLHVVLISAQVTTAAGVPWLEVATFGTFAEVQRVIASGIDGVREVWNGYLDLRSVRAENDALRRDRDRLQLALQAEREAAQQADRLRALLELKERSALDAIAAEVIAGAADGESRLLTVNKGTIDGAGTDQAVIAPSGAVGRVIVATPRAAKVQLLTDQSAAAGALVERSRVQGLVVGAGDRLRMEYVPGTGDVVAGDQVVTSGIDGIYPKGLPIGVVESVERGPGTFHAIVLRPAVDFARLEEVLIVLSPPSPGDGARGDSPE